MNQSDRCAIAVIVAWLGFMCAAAIEPGAAAEDIRIDQARRAAGNVAFMRLRLPLNKSQTVRLPYSFNDLLVGSTKFVDAVPLSNQEIYVLGKELGTTNISILDRDKHLLGLIDVEVGLDAGEIAAKVHAAIGSRAIRVGTRDNKIVLSGAAPDAPTVDRAVSIASALAPEGGGVINMIRVASPQQVLLHVRLVEVSRNASRELGFRWEYTNGASGARVGHVGGGVRVSDLIPAVATATLERTAVAPFGQILGRFLGNSQQLDLVISALEEKGLARRLAEPNLVALSGDTADFLAGGEFPVPVGTQQGSVPTIKIEFKEFGVRLSFTPTVLANGAINLRLEPEVSEIDRSISVNTGIVSVPGLSKRRAKTTVELRDGQSFAIAGLLQAITESDIEQFPWLGSVPVLGSLFRSMSFRQRETELVVIVTPHLVKPAKPGAAIETPLDTTVPSNDVDSFLMGKLDRKKVRPAAVEQYIAVAGSVAGPHGHILSAPAPVPDPGPIAPVPVVAPEAKVRAKN